MATTLDDELDRMIAEEDAALAASAQAGSPLNLPISSGRMYMGPQLLPGVEEAFLQMPSGTSWNLAPPPTAPAPTELERLQAADLPGSRTISIRRDVPIPVDDERSIQFAQLQEWNRLAALGIPPEERIKRVGIGVLGGGVKPMNEYQRENLAMQGRRLDLLKAGQEARMQPTQTTIITQPRNEGMPALPGVAAKKGFLGFGGSPAIPPTPAVEATPETRTIIKGPAPKTVPAGTEKVRVKSPDGKVGFIPASQLRAALNQGYTQVR